MYYYFLCYIDYVTACDEVLSQNQTEMLWKLYLIEKDTRIAYELYLVQTICIRIENILSKPTEIERMCLLTGFIIFEHKNNNIRNADDTAVMADTKGNLHDKLVMVWRKARSKN